MMSGDLPPFEGFFEAVHGFSPFPWQRVLAERAAAGRWPTQLSIPTGLGKTASLDVAVWALAAQAATGGPRTAPTRTYYVVNRRLLVDAAYDHALDLATRLHAASSGPLAEVADQLRSVAALGVADDRGQARPLHVCRLRGGAELGARPPDPSQPTLLFATVPMFASRLLFRGYGVSRSMRPVDAALAGTDSLLLLDEAHLSRPLMKLLTELKQCDAGGPDHLLPEGRRHPRLVSLTATGDQVDGALGLDEDDDDPDTDHAVVQRRIGARKPTTLVTSSRRRLPGVLADQARELLADVESTAACVVFTNTVQHAMVVAGDLEDEDVDLHVLTGRMREPEARSVRERLLGEDGVGSGRSGSERRRPLVVVATQTLEVGADLDFDLLVTESAGVRALVQRLGRLNRLGERNDVARAVVVHAKGDDPVYGEEPAAVAGRLQEATGSGAVDLGPAGVSVLGAPDDEPARSAELLPVQLWEWAKTSRPPPGEAPLEPFYGGFEEQLARVAVAWRAWLPPNGERLVPPLDADEVVEVPIGGVRDLVGRLPEAHWVSLDPDGTAGSTEGLRPGSTVVFDGRSGGYTNRGWDPTSKTPVVDVSISERGWVPLDGPILGRWLASLGVAGDAAVASLVTNEDGDTIVEQLNAAAEELQAIHGDAAAVLRGWSVADLRVAEAPLPRTRSTTNQQESLRVAHLRTSDPVFVDVRHDAFDDLSHETGLAPRGDVDPRHLDAHGAAVRDAAAQISAALGLPEDVSAAVRTAAELHDVGKADERFQHWLDPDGTSAVLLAKGDGRRTWRSDRAQAGWPVGARHELLSGRAVAAALQDGTFSAVDDQDLLLHLVLSHHGGGRPLVDTVNDPLAATQVFDVDGQAVEISTDVAADDWEQPARFRRLCTRYGYWGLALLEAVVRQADHAASAAQQRTMVVA